MALIEINFTPCRKDLMRFSMGGGLLLFVVALVLRLRGHDAAWLPAIFVACGVLLAICPFVSLTVTRWIYLGLVVLTWPIGWTISTVMLLLIYYGLLMPVGLFFRVTGRDPLHRRIDPQAGTYWVPRTPAQNKKRYFQQF